MADKFDFTAYNERYKKEHYEQVIVRVKKGDKEKLKKAASEAGMTVNSFIIACLQEKLNSN